MRINWQKSGLVILLAVLMTPFQNCAPPSNFENLQSHGTYTGNVLNPAALSAKIVADFCHRLASCNSLVSEATCGPRMASIANLALLFGVSPGSGYSTLSEVIQAESANAPNSLGVPQNLTAFRTCTGSIAAMTCTNPLIQSVRDSVPDSFNEIRNIMPSLRGCSGVYSGQGPN